MVRKKHLLKRISFLEERIDGLQKELNAAKGIISDMSEKVTFVFNNYNPNAQKETNKLLDEWMNGDSRRGGK